MLLFLAKPGAALADTEDLIVEHNPTDSSHFTSIQAALNHAATILRNPLNSTSFRVIVQADPVPYSAPATLISDVPIIGSSTAGTFLSGNGSGTVISATGVSRVAIRNFTFRSATVAIALTNCSAIEITNDIFELGTAATAIRVQNGSSLSITNNTFYNNGTAISTNADATISNDIFYRNNIAIASEVALTALSYNDFFGNGSNGVADLGAHSIPSDAVPVADPRFADVPGRDFHLRSDSPCIDAGNPQLRDSFDNTTSDMGAYGGPYSDTGLAAVTGVTSSLTSPATISVSWNRTGDSSVTAYRVYYGTSATDRSGTGADEGASPIEVHVPATTATLSNPGVPVPERPARPQLTAVVPRDEGLDVGWTEVTGATGYRVYYSSAAFESSSPPSTFVDVHGGATTSTSITGLKNGTRYFVAVSALAQAQLFVWITAVKDTGIASNPGGANESPLSLPSTQLLGAPQQSALSVVQSEFPEKVSPYPELVNRGCFIATAAYGFYSAPQVQALRLFRDRYLLTNSPGRAFVAWYYRHGPSGARFLNEHPWLKPPVRLALLPLVALALFLIYVPLPAKLAVLFLCSTLLLRYLQRKGEVKLRPVAGGSR